MDYSQWPLLAESWMMLRCDTALTRGSYLASCGHSPNGNTIGENANLLWFRWTMLRAVTSQTRRASMHESGSGLISCKDTTWRSVIFQVRGILLIHSLDRTRKMLWEGRQWYMMSTYIYWENCVSPQMQMIQPSKKPWWNCSMHRSKIRQN